MPSNLVSGAISGISRKPPVTTNRLVMAWAIRGVVAATAASTASASPTLELSATKVNKPGISALTASRGNASNRWYTCGKLVSTAASTSAGGSPVAPATKSTKAPTSPAAPPCTSTIGSAMAAMLLTIATPASIPATRCSTNAGRRSLMARWPPSRRGNSPRTKTPPATTMPTSVTTDQPRVCTSAP